MTSILQKIKAVDTRVDNISFGADAEAVNASITDLQTQINDRFIFDGTSTSSLSHSLIFNKKLSKASIPSPSDMTNDSEGDIYVLSDENVMKFDKDTGNLLWIVEDILFSKGYKIMVDQEDKIIVVGVSSVSGDYSRQILDTEDGSFGGGNLDILLKRFDKNGNVIRATNGGNLYFGSSGAEDFLSATTFEDNLYIVGETNDGNFGSYLIGEGNNDDLFILKKNINDRYDTRDSPTPWVRRIGSRTLGSEGRNALIVADSEGYVYVTGKNADISIGSMITGEVLIQL